MNARDVADHGQAEEAALRTAEAKYRTLVERLRLVIYIAALADARQPTLYISPQVEPLLGFSEAEWFADSELWSKLLHPDDRERVLADRAHSWASGEPFFSEYRLLARDGHVVWVRDEAAVVQDEAGQPLCLQGFLLDITDRKRAEEALRESEEQLRQSQKMEAIGRLAGGIAHDFNNLLLVIRGYSELALRRLDEADPLRRELEEISQAAERASDLTHQLLAFGRRQVLEPRVLDLNTEVTEIETMLRRLIGEDIDLLTALDPELGRVEADPSQIQQVIANLVVNARDAMPRGGKLTIETANVELDDTYARAHVAVQPGRYVMLAVSDNGVGMDEETKAHVFEPFFTTKGEGEGTGLGLATVYGIVKQSGGYIWVYSEPGRGATFKIYLPQVEADLDSEPEIALTGLVGGSETILLAEDNDAVRRLVREALELAGYTVLEASRGAEALLVAERHGHQIDLLLTDVVMPDMDGAALIEQLEAVRPQLPVIYMSGYAEAAVAHRGVLKEGRPFVQKPFAGGALLRKVREVLDAP